MSTRGERFRAAYLVRAPRLIAFLARLFGVLTLLDAFAPNALHGFRPVTRLVRILPDPGTAAAAATVAVGAMILLRVAAGLRKRKRVAWRVAVVVTSVLVAAHILKGRHIGSSLLFLALLILLITARSRFTAKSDPGSRWAAVRALAQILIVALSYGLALLYVYPRFITGHPSLGDRLREVFLGLVGVQGPVEMRRDLFDDVFHATMFGFGLLIVAVVFLVVLRPPEPVARLSEDDEERLRVLLGKHGHRDSLGYFALRRDKAVIWSATGKAAVAYRVVQGVALASGDPIGDPEAWPGAISAFADMVADYGWTPAVVGCSETGATVYRRECGLTAIELGDEAIIEVPEFTLDGRSMRGVRQACGRAERVGYQLQVRRMSDVSVAEVHELAVASAAWRDAETERGFSMALSRVGDRQDPDCVLVTAHLDGALRGILHFVPWGGDGLSLDLMRRDRSADNGLNELMIVSVIRAAEQLGVRRISLNFAVFRDAIERGERIGAGPILRAWRAVLLFASRWWQIESLYRFNVKFRPVWEPRFLSFPATRDLPRIAIAALEAEAFLVRPKFLRRRIDRTPDVL